MTDISNQQRFWFIIFALWCKKHGKDHKTEDFNQIKDSDIISSEEYEELRQKAIFEVLKSGLCPECWTKHGQKLAAMPKQPDSWWLKCPCGIKYVVDGVLKIGDYLEDE